MRLLLNLFFSSLFLVFISVTSMLFYFIALVIKIVTFPFDRKLIALNLFSCFWAVFYIWCMPVWRVRVHGRHRLSFRKHYIFVSNHQSQLDILVAFTLFFPFRWISKETVFKLPFVGWNMTLNRYVKLKRGDKESIKRMMDQCESILKQNCSLFFFPEGTRSATGELKPFKPGAFILARKFKTDIVPVVIKGTREALPKHTFKLTGKKKMSIEVLEPVAWETLAELTPEAAAERVRHIISNRLEHGND